MDKTADRQRKKDIDYGRRLERAAVIGRIQKAYKDSDHFESGGLASHEIINIVLNAVNDKG